AFQADGVLQSLTTDLTASAVLDGDPVFISDITTGSGNIYWRIGARNSTDIPGPIHWISKDPHDGDRTFRWVYSFPRAFTPAVTPPPPPRTAKLKQQARQPGNPPHGGRAALPKINRQPPAPHK